MDCSKTILSKYEFQQIIVHLNHLIMISKFAGYIEFIDKILEFYEKSLSFWHFLEFFRP